jgi:hypothetical protein
MSTRKQLERKRERLQHALPPMDQILRASLFQRVRRCGRPGCHCARGEGHPSYYIGVSAPEGKTIQVSLPRDVVPVAREWIANYERLWRFIEGISAVNRELLRERWVEPRARRGRKRSG